MAIPTPQAHYEFNDNLATSNVIATLGTDGTYTGKANTAAAHVASGQFTHPSCFSFDGSANGGDDIVTLNWSLGTSNDMSFGGWYRFNTVTVDQGLFSTYDGENGIRLVLEGATKNITLYVIINFVNIIVRKVHSSVLQTGVWYYISFTKSGDIWTIYVNSTASSPTTAAATLINMSTPIIGKSYSGSFDPVDGNAMAVTLWNVALSAANVVYLYNHGKPMLYPWLTPFIVPRVNRDTSMSLGLLHQM